MRLKVVDTFTIFSAMAGFTGSYTKLRNTALPLEERIELSREILRNSNYFLPNKIQVVVDWLCEELSCFGKKGQDVVTADKQQTELWKVLNEVLNDPASEQIVLRPKMLPLLFNELNEMRLSLRNGRSESGVNEMVEDRVLSVLLCFKAISKNPNMSLTFFYKLDNLEQYLKGVLTCFLIVLLQPDLHSAIFVEELFQLVVVVLAQYGTAVRQQVSQSKVFANICEKLLHLLLLVRSALEDKLLSFQVSSKGDLGSAIDNVIISGLFNKDLVVNYTDNSASGIPQKETGPSAKKRKLANTYSKLFDVLESFATGSEEDVVIDGINIGSSLVHQTLSASLPFLLENFLKATKADGKMENASKLSFFVELYNVVVPTLNDAAEKKIPEDVRIEILNTMLKVIMDHDVYQIAEDNVNGQPIYKWFQTLMKSELLSQSPDNPGRFHCLDIILKLNHKIIEESLEHVLVECFASAEQCSDAKIELLCDVVETYSKLKQTENLVACLLKVFKNLGSRLGTIPVDVLAKLSRSFEKCLFNQTLSILQLFLKEMKENIHYLEDENAALLVEGISILFVTFLLNSSFNAADSHGVDEKKANNLMELIEDIKTSIITPLVKAVPKCRKSCQKQVGFSTLYLIYGLNSMILFLHQHDVIPASDDHYIKLLWDSKLEAYIPDESWTGLALFKKIGRMRYCMVLLSLHRVQLLLLKPNLDRNELDQLLNFLFHFQDPEISSVSWNSDPSCVTSKNYHVAHWSLVTQHASVLIPYCSENQVEMFAQFIVGSLVVQEKEISSENLVTLRKVSENVLKIDELLCVSSCQTAVVTQCWKLVGAQMSQVVGDKLSGVFTWEVDNQSADGEEVDETDELSQSAGKRDNQTVISLAQMIAKVMNDLGDKKVKKRRCTGELSMVADLLKVLQRLRCHQFTPNNQVHCILGCLACDVLLGKAASDNQTLGVQLSCREIISTILQGLLQQREFSAWKAVDMTSLLRWLYHTMLQENQFAETRNKTSPANLQCKFLKGSKDLLRLAVILSLKSQSRASLTAITDFSQELVNSLTDPVKNGSAEIVRCVDVLFTLVSAWTEFLDQKRKSSSSFRAACSAISNIMIGLADFMKEVLEEDANLHDESHVQLEAMMMSLCGILTRAMGLISGTADVSENEDFTKASKGWTEVVSMLMTKVLRKIEEYSVCKSDLGNDITPYITVSQNVFKGSPEHRASIADELRPQLLRKCLEILKKIGFPFDEGVSENGPEEWRKLQESVVGLIVGLLEEDDGRNCVTVLDGVLEWSVGGNEEDKLISLVGLSVFRDLLAVKVAKLHKKKLRPVTGKIMVTLLSQARINSEILCVVLEIVAALVTLGSGVFYPEDLALVFQALAFHREVTSMAFFSRIFMAKFAILSWTLFYYPDYVYGTVHVFLSCVRGLLSNLLSQGVGGGIDSKNASILANCAQKMARLYQEMASHKDVLSKYSIYILADCVHLMCTQGVPGIIRDVLVQGVHTLFDICNDDALTKLHVYLPNDERELFRSLKEDYIKHHKFKGNA